MLLLIVQIRTNVPACYTCQYFCAFVQGEGEDIPPPVRMAWCLRDDFLMATHPSESCCPSFRHRENALLNQGASPY